MHLGHSNHFIAEVARQVAGRPQIDFPALQYQVDAGWTAVSPMPSASWLNPVLVRLRVDKKPDAVDTRFAQILERCMVEQASTSSLARVAGRPLER